ncbi:MAG: GNAT family N-acetyltransferase [Kosmotogaceae bacterium]
MIRLEKMKYEEFEDYQEKLVRYYAIENVKSGRWEESSALEKARMEIDALLSEGLETKNHELLSIIETDNSQTIGYLWLHIFPRMEKKGFIYDFVIHKELRGKGYGKLSLEALEEHARELGVEQLSLHVFAHNTAAVSLYKEIGYEVTSMNMAKQISNK